MDSLQVKKIQAINNYRKQRLLNNLMLYSFTALTCFLFLSSPLWYPFLRASVKIFLFDFLPRIGALLLSSKCIFIVGNLIIIILVGESKISKSRSSSLPSNLKELNHAEQEKEPYRYDDEEKDMKEKFIFLDGESNFSGSRNTSLLPQEEDFREYYDIDKVHKSVNLEQDTREDCKNKCSGNEAEKEDKFKGEEFKFTAAPNELDKRADDFIARVNKQIRLEAVTIV